MKKSMTQHVSIAALDSIGLDLAHESSVFCHLSRDGKILEKGRIPMTRPEMRKAFEARPRSTVLMEACTPSSWVATLLEEIGHDVVVCNPRRLKVISSSSFKTDELDARALARIARMRQFEPDCVVVTTVRARETLLARSILSGREQLMRMRTGLISHVRNVLVADAVPKPKCDADDFATTMRRLKLPADVWSVIEPLVETIEVINGKIKGMEAQIKGLLKEMEVARRWNDIPGVGRLTMLAFALTIEDPSRFPSARAVGPFLGLVPSVYQTGAVERRGRITKQGDERMRRLLVQAAYSLMRSTADCALRRWGLKLAALRGKKKAAIAVARKLAVIMMRMWTTGEDFVPFPQAA